MFKDEFKPDFCSICGKMLNPVCGTKIVDGVAYCIDCYKRDVYPLRMKKLRENKNVSKR